MDNLLTVRNVTKTYPGVLALDRVSFEVRPGEVHALIGENGAGKSTLIKVLTGAIEPDSGEIEYDGRKYEKMTPALSRSVGISAIYQEFNLAPSVTVAENIFIGTRLNKGIFVDFKKLYAEAERVLSNFHVKISPRATVNELTVAYKQLVEIAKAIAQESKLIIMDEPTAPLTDDEVDNLFEIVHQLKARGVAIIFISHRMEELFRISDRVTVMRDGAVISTYNTADITKGQLIKDMVGRKDCTVVNISSMNAFTPLTKIPAYSAAKAGISNFTQWMAVHFSKVGIRVNALAPGFFITNQNRNMLIQPDGSYSDRAKKIIAGTPMERFGEKEELIGTLLYLLNEKASGFVTGVVIPVDGGFSAYSGV